MSSLSLLFVLQESHIPREVKTVAAHPCHPINTSGDSSGCGLPSDACSDDVQRVDIPGHCVWFRYRVPDIRLDKVPVSCWVNTGQQRLLQLKPLNVQLN